MSSVVILSRYFRFMRAVNVRGRALCTCVKRNRSTEVKINDVLGFKYKIALHFAAVTKWPEMLLNKK